MLAGQKHQVLFVVGVDFRVFRAPGALPPLWGRGPHEAGSWSASGTPGGRPPLRPPVARTVRFCSWPASTFGLFEPWDPPPSVLVTPAEACSQKVPAKKPPPALRGAQGPASALGVGVDFCLIESRASGGPGKRPLVRALGGLQPEGCWRRSRLLPSLNPEDPSPLSGQGSAEAR